MHQVHTTHGLVSIPTNLERIQGKYAASLLHSHRPLDRSSKGEVSPGSVKCLMLLLLSTTACRNFRDSKEGWLRLHLH